MMMTPVPPCPVIKNGETRAAVGELRDGTYDNKNDVPLEGNVRI